MVEDEATSSFETLSELAFAPSMRRVAIGRALCRIRDEFTRVEKRTELLACLRSRRFPRPLRQMLLERGARRKGFPFAPSSALSFVRPWNAPCATNLSRRDSLRVAP